MDYKTFYDFEIKPILEEIDVMIKCEDEISFQKCKELLSLTDENLTNILETYNIDNINSNNFHTIMEHGESEICKLYKRAIENVTLHTFTPENIAYIYNLNFEKVKKAFDENNVVEATNYTLNNIFSSIDISLILKN